MYAGANIATWSLIEEGVGICAGSLHALRPLLSLSIFGTAATGSTDVNSASAENRFQRSKRSNIKLDTFHQLVNITVKDPETESQKHIMKETRVTVTSDDRTCTPREWEENQVLGWQNKPLES